MFCQSLVERRLQGDASSVGANIVVYSVANGWEDVVVEPIVPWKAFVGCGSMRKRTIGPAKSWYDSWYDNPQTFLSKVLPIRRAREEIDIVRLAVGYDEE